MIRLLILLILLGLLLIIYWNYDNIFIQQNINPNLIHKQMPYVEKYNNSASAPAFEFDIDSNNSDDNSIFDMTFGEQDTKTNMTNFTLQSGYSSFTLSD